MNEELMQLVMGGGRFPCKGGGCRHQNSGWFIYFDAEEYLFIFECEENPEEHDIRISGRWDDGSPISKMKREILRLWKKEGLGKFKAVK